MKIYNMQISLITPSFRSLAKLKGSVIEKNITLDFAYFLHTDFGKNFIRAIDVKSKRTVGKDHPLKNLDIVEIVANK